MNLPKAIYQLRKEHKLPQCAFELGKNQLTLIESGRVEPTLTTLKKICDVFGIKVSELIIKSEEL